MAWRLNAEIEHGFIDNTVEGSTTGKIWLAGRDEPLILRLNGDCWRDLAGTLLEFENPNPRISDTCLSIHTDQTGIIGDMTASRKCRVPTISEEEFTEYHFNNREIPFIWKNALYLEWFSELNGRVVIEVTDFELQISEHAWEMDEDYEEAQKLANMNSMRDFMAQVLPVDSQSPDMLDFDNGTCGLDESEWEQRFKENDFFLDAFQEVTEKYKDDPNATCKEAFVMSWDKALEEMANGEEHAECGFGAMDEDFGDPPAGWRNRFASDFSDAVLERAQVLRDHVLEHFDYEFEATDLACDRLPLRLQQTESYLRSYLGPDSFYTKEKEATFISAVLKRCLGWLNEAIGCCNQMMEDPRFEKRAHVLEFIRKESFGLRDGVLEIRRSLKQH